MGAEGDLCAGQLFEDTKSDGTFVALPNRDILFFASMCREATSCDALRQTTITLSTRDGDVTYEEHVVTLVPGGELVVDQRALQVAQCIAALTPLCDDHQPAWNRAGAVHGFGTRDEIATIVLCWVQGNSWGSRRREWRRCLSQRSIDSRAGSDHLIT